MHISEENIGVGDDYLPRGGVTLENLTIGLQNLANEFAEFRNRRQAQFEE